MPSVKVYNREGKEAGTVELDSAVFTETAKPELIYQVVRVFQSRIRQPLAFTKMRSEVRGGGKKPWKQKGTGRARHGSIRSPIWKGGGVTFGPRGEASLTRLSIPRKMVQKAMRAVLSEKVQAGTFVVVEGLAFEKPSTKSLKELIAALSLAGKKRLLMFTDSRMENTIRSARNIPTLRPLRLENMNIVDVLKHETVLIDKDSIPALTKQLK
ncbi:MAG: 50S ribosomal protein L4 [Parcubacteria group bacterium]|nr:50S ribosomal protein L4 [Parcubacteria group bacterium]